MRRLIITFALLALLPTLAPMRAAIAAPTQDYIVKPGDTLLALATRFGTSVSAIMAENELADPDELQIGQVLKIPLSAGASLGGAAMHVVAAGDTLSGIGARYGLSAADLAAANGISEAALLQIGQKLVVPGRGGGAAPQVALVPLDAPVAVPLPIPADAETSADHEAVRAQLIDLYNQVRAANGVPPLTLSPVLQASAQAHADDCTARGACSHIGSDGSRSSQRMARAGFAGRITGENWAWARSAAEAFEFWYTREIPSNGPHLRNILSPRYSEVGFGVSRSRGGLYLIANFGAQ